MLDILAGIFGGFVSPHLSRCLIKYKFRYTFIFASVITWFGFFIAVWIAMGWGDFIIRFFTYDAQIFLVPFSFAVGLFSVFIVWAYAPYFRQSQSDAPDERLDGDNKDERGKVSGNGVNR